MKLSKTVSRTKSLRWQLLSRFFLILVALLIIMGIYQYLTMGQYLYKSKEILLEARFHIISRDTLANIQDTDDVIKYARELIQNSVDENITVAVIDNQGNIIASDSKPMSHNKNDIGKKIGDEGLREENITVPKLKASEYIKLLNKNGNLEGNRLVRDDNNNVQVVIWRKLGDIHNPYGLIQFSTPVNVEQSILNNQVYIYIIASVMVLIIGALLGAAVFKRTLKPLSNMTDTVEQINVGKLNIRLPEDNGQLEIDRLSNAFNDMLGRIESSFRKEQYIKEKMRRFVSDASHELRTPLTSIHGFVEVLLRGAAKNEKQLNSSLNSILIESERLTKLVNDLLMLTKLDQKVSVEMDKENINNIVKEVFPQLQILSGHRKIHLELGNDIIVNINKDQIKQVIFNLVQNAVHHTDEIKGSILISTGIEEISSHSFAVLKIEDNGTGIPKEHLSEIFDRFFRSEAHRSRKQGGYGLGLSIVKSIVDAHDGKIEVESELGIGTTFSVYLNLIRD